MSTQAQTEKVVSTELVELRRLGIKQFLDLTTTEKNQVFQELSPSLCDRGKGFFLAYCKDSLDPAFARHCHVRYRNCYKCRDGFFGKVVKLVDSVRQSELPVAAD